MGCDNLCLSTRNEVLFTVNGSELSGKTSKKTMKNDFIKYVTVPGAIRLVKGVQELAQNAAELLAEEVKKAVTMNSKA